MNKEIKDEFTRKLDCIFEYFNSFRFHAEQRRNLLRMQKEGVFEKIPFSPSDKVELEHLEKLIDETNDLFPYVIPVQEFKKEILENHG